MTEEFNRELEVTDETDRGGRGRASKKPYSKPKLVVYGDIGAITTAQKIVATNTDSLGGMFKTA